jgi:isopenicillin N synthase-like dioxygenase
VNHVPTVDLRPWWDGTDRDGVAARVDEALRTAGFLLVTGHGVDPALRAEVRSAAREFFALPDDVKAKYAVGVGGRGWLPPGVEANGYAEGTVTPPDRKESYSLAADDPTGDPTVDREWFLPNVWPTEAPRLRPALTEYLRRMRSLADELMSVCAVALGLPADHFAAYLTHPTFGFNLNWYPPLRRVGSPESGQFRMACTPTSAR